MCKQEVGTKYRTLYWANAITNGNYSLKMEVKIAKREQRDLQKKVLCPLPAVMAPHLARLCVGDPQVDNVLKQCFRVKCSTKPLPDEAR